MEADVVEEIFEEYKPNRRLRLQYSTLRIDVREFLSLLEKACPETRL